MTREELLEKGWERLGLWFVRGLQSIACGYEDDDAPYWYVIPIRALEPHPLEARGKTIEEALSKLGEYSFVDGKSVREWALEDAHANKEL